MITRSRSLTLALCMSVLCAACVREPELIDATQVIVTLRSALRTELKEVEATVYDPDEQKQGDGWTFDLAKKPLPFSFTVIPRHGDTAAFLLVLTGRTPGGEEVLQHKVVVRFVARKTVGLELWLSEGCVRRVCDQGQTCLPSKSDDTSCGPVPTLEGDPTTPGQELDSSVIVEASSVSEAGAQTSTDSGEPATDAGTTTVPEAEIANPMSSLDAGAPSAAPGNSACIGTPNQAVCNDRTLIQCNEAGEVAKQELCATARQCQLGSASKVCAPCDPGGRRCTGTRLERCSEDGSRWELLKTCESEPLCNAVAGDCIAGACTATTRVCMGADLYGCSEDLTQLTRLRQCSSSTLCDQNNGECDNCTPNSRVCSTSSSNTVESCDSRGQVLTRTECMGTTPKCSGAGVCVQCTAATDCAVPSNTCSSAICNTTTARCGTTPKAAHIACTGGVCNGSGTCVECVDETDCKSAGKRRCANARCVACTANADCPASYECNLTSNTCQKVSLAGTGTSCVSTSAATSGMCGGLYCGVTPARFSLAYNPAATCGSSASFHCSGALASIASNCLTQHALDSDPSASGRTCIAADSSVQAASVTTACINCYVGQQECCKANDNCFTTCLISGGTKQCDDAMRAAGCIGPTLFNCTGLPNPL